VCVCVWNVVATMKFSHHHSFLEFSTIHFTMTCCSTDVASFITTCLTPSSSSHKLHRNRKYSHVSSTPCCSCMYPARRGVGKRTQYFAWDQTKTLRSVWNGKNFVGRKTWTTGKTQIQEPLFLHSTRHQTLSKSDSIHLSNSKQIVNEKDSFESTPNHDSTVPSSVSSNNSHNNMNNNTDTSRTRKVPKAVAKARANGEPVVFVEGKWVCMDCGYIYPDDASVPFEDLPDNWR